MNSQVIVCKEVGMHIILVLLAKLLPFGFWNPWSKLLT
jgi:hypothetical protein